MMVLGRYIGGGKGATALEFQFDRFGIRYVHLRGHYFGRTIFSWPWRRLSFQWFSLEQAGRSE